MKPKSNMLKIVFKALLLFLLASAVCSQATKQTKTMTGQNSNGIITYVIDSESTKEKLDKKAYENYINGVIAEQVHDYFNASKFYNEALQKYPESFEIRLSLAECYYRMQKFHEAIKTLEPIYPENLDVYSLRGICYRSLGKNQEAKETYLKLVELDSLNQAAFGFLSSEYRRLNQLDSLVWTYIHLVQSDGQNHRWWSELGQLQNQQGKYEEAKNSYAKSLTLSKGRENLLAYIGLAESYRGLNQPDSATQLYKEAIQFDQHNLYLNRALASHYAELDSFSLALQYAEKLNRLEPNSIPSKRYLALMYVRADSIFQAEGLFKSLVEAGDNEPGNYFYLGRIAIIKKDFETAREYLTILTHLADTLADGWLDLGFVYRSQNDTAKSLNVYHSGLQFVKYKEDSVRLLFAVGATLERTNRVEEASQTFEKLLTLDPENSQALNYFGYMLADRGEKLNYAHNLIKRALEMSPENAAYIDSYGWVMYRLGKLDSAVTYLEKAVAILSDPIIFDHLGDAYKGLGKMEDARIWWQKALELEPTNDTIREKLNE